MAQPTEAAGNGVGLFSTGSPIWMFLLPFAIMYFLIIRPQQKKQKEHREMIQNLKKGDRVITGGGIHGRVTGMDDATFTVEIADKVRVKINRGNVAAVVQPGAKDQAAKK